MSNLIKAMSAIMIASVSISSIARCNHASTTQNEVTEEYLLGLTSMSFAEFWYGELENVTAFCFFFGIIPNF